MKKQLILILIGLHFVNIFFAQEVITLDLASPTKPTEFLVDAEKGYWVETYNTAEEYRNIEFGLFSFTHILNAFGGTDVGGGMSYWDGFTYCTSGDTTDYGEYGSSDGWVPQQWGCMAGGGIKTNEKGEIQTDENGKVLVEKGIPYLVAYWGYWIEMEENGAPCLQINFRNNEIYEPVGVYIANHPWPYYGNIHGDGFARPFEEGDSFKLIAHGLNEVGEDIGVEVEHILAEFKDGELRQSPDWEWIDLSALGAVSGVYFTMTTTDADPIYGPNTAVYFCLDKLQVLPPKSSTIPTRPTGLTSSTDETTIHFSWTASTGTAGVRGYNVYINNEFKSYTTDTHYRFTDLLPYTKYKLGVEALAPDDNLSQRASITTATTDETAPTSPRNLTGTATAYTMTLSWDASTDNVAVTRYYIYLNGKVQKGVTTTNYTLTGLDENTEYFVEVEARDAAGNRSERANTIITTSSLSNTESIVGGTRINIYSNSILIERGNGGVLEVYSHNGVKLLSQSISSGDSTIDISHLTSGIYILRYNNVTEKIIKQ